MKDKLTPEEKKEIREEKKSWNQFIKKMEMKGALVNDSAIHDDWTKETISETDVQEG